MTHVFRRLRPHAAITACAVLLAATACSDASTSISPALQPAFARTPAAKNTIAVTIAGLPAGSNAGVQVTGPGGYRSTVNASSTLTGLNNGSYSFSAASVTAGGTTYSPSPASASVSVNKGSTGTVAITFAAAPVTGSLAVSISVPGGAPGNVTVTGPNAFSQTLTSTTTLSALSPGSYVVNAANVTFNSVIYGPAVATQTATVNVGQSTTTSVIYSAIGVVPGDLNLQILGMTLTQSVQTMGNTVTLIANRPGMLRVFAVANAANSVQPAVRARFYLNGALASTLDGAAAGASVPTTLNPGSATASWNFIVPASLMQPGLSIVAEVDPTNVVAEASETDNRFPVSGTPQPMTVRGVTPLNVTFVPVMQSSTGGAGAINASNADAFLQATNDMLPVGTVQYVVRDTFTTSAVLVSDGTGWNQVLSEVYALRSSDGSSRNYYGVVKVGYSSGVAGMGYIGAAASIGWDYLSSGTTTMAHELGHNFGRQHAPCGGVAGPDPNYPYAGGIIGVFGYNVRTSSVIPSTAADLMGYCSPRWISDYNFNAIMNYRGFTTAAPMANAVDQDGLLVWGRISADGSITMEPAVSVTAPAVLPQQAGDFALEGTDAAGNRLFSFSFNPVMVADGIDGDGHFAFVIPMGAPDRARLTTLGLSGRGRSASKSARQTPAALAAAAAAADIASESDGRARLRWDATAFPMVIVRNPDTGEILSFAREGNMALSTRRADVEVVFSDGVRSASNRVRIRGR